MRLITFRVERSEPTGERSRNVGVSYKIVLRLRGIGLRPVSPLTHMPWRTVPGSSRLPFGRTNLYSPFAAWKRSAIDQVGEESS
jgi:hypothetical protein